jgi:hypothetical protein
VDVKKFGNIILFAGIALSLVGVAPNAFAADGPTKSPDAVYFAKDWCPHQADLDALDKIMTRMMDGCCISTGFLTSEGKNSPSALLQWDRFMKDSPQAGACSGTPSANPVVNLTKEELEEYARLEKQRREELARMEKEGVKQYAETLRKLDRNVFCYGYGRVIRGEDFPSFISAAAAKNVVKKEAARRKLQFNEKLVLDEKIKIGMSQCQMYASWGEPNDENRSVGPWGVHIQHVYGNSYVYTENGKIKSYQN